MTAKGAAPAEGAGAGPGARAWRDGRAGVRAALGGPAATRPTGAWCDEPGATFVTLRWRSGDLQGCIGSLAPERAIIHDVASTARARPGQLGSAATLDVELSILSALESIASEAEIRVGIDGIVLVYEFRRA